MGGVRTHETISAPVDASGRRPPALGGDCFLLGPYNCFLLGSYSRPMLTASSWDPTVGICLGPYGGRRGVEVSWDPTVGLCLGLYNGPRGVELFYERGTPVVHLCSVRRLGTEASSPGK